MTRTRKPAEPTLAESLVREALPPCKYFLSTGCDLLDLAVSDRLPGGVGSGRVTQIIGDNSTAKSVLLQEILGSAQRQGGYACEEEAEFTPNFQRAELFGLDVGRWKDELFDTNNTIDEAMRKCGGQYVYRNPKSIEDFFDNEMGGVFNNNVTDNLSPLVFGVDTFTALPSNAELEREIAEKSYNMERAKSMSAGFRKWIRRMGMANVTIIAVDHIRSSMNAGFGKKWTTSGGLAMQQYSSTRIFLKHVETLKNSHDVKIGVKIHFKIVKNKLAPPFREGHFFVMFDFGLDNVRSNLEWLLSQKIENKLTKEKNTMYWNSSKVGAGIDKLIRYIENENLENELSSEVERVWRIMHQTDERKKRVR